jgi:hypothetical protein
LAFSSRHGKCFLQRAGFPLLASAALVLPAPGIAAPALPDSADELIRQQQRERAVQEREDKSTDVRLKRPVVSEEASRLATDESPCFTIDRLILVGDDAERFRWALSAADGDNDSPIGHCLGSKGKFAFFNYLPGSIYDRIAEAYAGPHDMLNSAIWYDSAGNIKAGVAGSWLGKIGDITNYTNVLFATPFAIPFLIPPEMIDAVNAGIKVNERKDK